MEDYITEIEAKAEPKEKWSMEQQIRENYLRSVGSDMVNHPPHYTKHKSGVECIAIAEHMNFCLGNAIKYLWRADLKNGTEDLKKAIWYINREIERRGEIKE